MTVTYTPIASATATGSSGTVSFNSIPQTYTDLILIMRLGYVSGSHYAIVRANGDLDSSSSYGNTYLGGAGAGVSTGRNASLSGFYSSYATIGDTTLDWVGVMQINNYANSTTYKNALTRSGRGSNGTESVISCRRTNTNAITALEIKATSSALFVSGSNFTLYGIKAE
jgi:hypothetical protein